MKTTSLTAFSAQQVADQLDIYDISTLIALPNEIAEMVFHKTTPKNLISFLIKHATYSDEDAKRICQLAIGILFQGPTENINHLLIYFITTKNTLGLDFSEWQKHFENLTRNFDLENNTRYLILLAQLIYLKDQPGKQDEINLIFQQLLICSKGNPSEARFLLEWALAKDRGALEKALINEIFTVRSFALLPHAEIRTLKILLPVLQLESLHHLSGKISRRKQFIVAQEDILSRDHMHQKLCIELAKTIAPYWNLDFLWNYLIRAAFPFHGLVLARSNWQYQNNPQALEALPCFITQMDLERRDIIARELDKLIICYWNVNEYPIFTRVCLELAPHLTKTQCEKFCKTLLESHLHPYAIPKHKHADNSLATLSALFPYVGKDTQEKIREKVLWHVDDANPKLRTAAIEGCANLALCTTDDADKKIYLDKILLALNTLTRDTATKVLAACCLVIKKGHDTNLQLTNALLSVLHHADDNTADIALLQCMQITAYLPKDKYFEKIKTLPAHSRNVMLALAKLNYTFPELLQKRNFGTRDFKNDLTMQVCANLFLQSADAEKRRVILKWLFAMLQESDKHMAIGSIISKLSPRLDNMACELITAEIHNLPNRIFWQKMLTFQPAFNLSLKLERKDTHWQDLQFISDEERKSLQTNMSGYIASRIAAENPPRLTKVSYLFRNHDLTLAKAKLADALKQELASGLLKLKTTQFPAPLTPENLAQRFDEFAQENLDLENAHNKSYGKLTHSKLQEHLEAMKKKVSGHGGVTVVRR